MATAQPPAVTYRDVFAVRDFRALFAAQLLSVAGDQFARVALAVLVWERTRSALLTAVTLAVSVVPLSAGGLFLGWLADAYPRRTVMICCDLISLALVLVMTVRGLPLAVLVVLLCAMTTAGAPFMAARSAVNADVLGEKFAKGNAVTQSAYYLAQVAGLGGGGAITAVLGVRGCLLADAGTFAASAVIIRAWVTRTPAADDRPRGPRAPGYRAGLRAVFSNPAALTAALLLWVSMFSVASEGVSLPLAHELGGGSRAAGWILAMPVAGAVIALQLWGDRFVPAAARRRLAGYGPCGLCGLLVLFAFHPPLGLALAVLGVSGAFACYINSSFAVFARSVPDRDLGKAFGVADAGLFLGQGIAVITAGALAEVIRPSWVIAASGAAGTVLAIGLAVAWRRVVSTSPAQAAEPEAVTSQAA